jgi:transcriptional regulator with XRE-family HTH domain
VAELKAFAGLDKALSRLVLNDGRTRKEIAAEAEINPSMFSGYCSGRLVPSLEHLDRILTALGAGIEELIDELRRSQARGPATQPGGGLSHLEQRTNAAAHEMLTTFLDEIRGLFRAQAQAVREAAEDADYEPEPLPPKPASRRKRR